MPEWLPLIGPELGYTNIVPVDFVAAALDHIAHAPGLDGSTFHLTDPDASTCDRRAQHVRKGSRGAAASRSRSSRARWPRAPRRAAEAMMALPGAHATRRAAARRVRRPGRDCRSHRPGSRVRHRESPIGTGRLRHRACPRSRATQARSGTTGHGTSTRTCTAARHREVPCLGKTVLITGASSGIGKCHRRADRARRGNGRCWSHEGSTSSSRHAMRSSTTAA